MHGVRGPYLVQLRIGPRLERLPGSDLVDGKAFAFRPGWQLGPELGGIYAGEIAMVTCDPTYPEAAPTWLPSGDLLPASLALAANRSYIASACLSPVRRDWSRAAQTSGKTREDTS